VGGELDEEWKRGSGNREDEVMADSVGGKEQGDDRSNLSSRRREGKTKKVG